MLGLPPIKIKFKLLKKTSELRVGPKSAFQIKVQHLMCPSTLYQASQSGQCMLYTLHTLQCPCLAQISLSPLQRLSKFYLSIKSQRNPIYNLPKAFGSRVFSTTIVNISHCFPGTVLNTRSNFTKNATRQTLLLLVQKRLEN